MINKLENIKNLDISTQRENLLKLNTDLIYWVYKIKENSDDKIILSNLEEIMTCYPNQFENLKWLKENSDIWIIDLWSLRKWKIKFLNRPESENEKYNKENIVLLSNWVIEVLKSNYKDKNWEIKSRNHFPLTLRDWWNIDQNQRTSVAWRNVWSDLNEDLNREYSEESPFIGKKEDWNYYLFTPENKNREQAVYNLKNSVEYFLKNKYNLDKNNENDLNSIKLMERSLRIKYEDLWKILEEILENNRIEFFESKKLENFDWIEKDIKEIETIDKMWNKISNWKFFVYFDKENNTIEYRWLREINIPEWVRATSRLFLESQNQWVINSRELSLNKQNLVPTLKYFSDKINEKIKKEAN